MKDLILKQYEILTSLDVCLVVKLATCCDGRVINSETCNEKYQLTFFQQKF